MLNPLLSKIMVFISGKLYMFNVLIPTGGHCNPISILGNNAASKYAQKKEKKNITSDKINNK
jgi:hypothetical protein